MPITLTSGDSYFPDRLGRADPRSGVGAEVLGKSALTLPASAALPAGSYYFPDAFPARDARAAVNSHTWSGWQVRINAVTRLPGAQSFPDRFTPPDRRVAVHSQPWVLGSEIIQQGAPNGPPPFPPPPLFPERIWRLDRQVSVRSQFDQHQTPPSDSFFTVATFTGSGALKADPSWNDADPLNYIPSWSIQIFGATIYGAEYDPTTRNLKVWLSQFYDFQFLILPNMPFNVTTAIQFAPDPETYVLALLG